jgi:four helix bundle protein
MKENIILEKSFKFGVRIILFYQYITKKRNEYEVFKQLLRSGTSVGANVEEAVGAQSRKDFLNKLSIAYKEARETRYWLRILKEARCITVKEFDSLITDCEELLKILGSIQITLKKRNKGSE